MGGVRVGNKMEGLSNVGRGALGGRVVGTGTVGTKVGAVVVV